MQIAVDWDLFIKVFLGVITLIMSGIALYYKRLEHRKKIDEIVDGNAKIGLFVSRQSMLKYLLGMYGRASDTDEIWGQSVSGRDYSQTVRDILLEAASRGVSFRIIINDNGAKSSELAALFGSLKSAHLAFAIDNSLRIQGLSNRECVVALPSANFYIAVLFRDKEVVGIFKKWFDERFNKLASLD